MVQSGGPKGFRADLVGEFVDGYAEFLEPAPAFVEGCFAAVLGLVEEGGFMMVWFLGLGLVGLVVWCRHVEWV